jgi:hypothetical protein
MVEYDEKWQREYYSAMDPQEGELVAQNRALIRPEDEPVTIIA